MVCSKGFLGVRSMLLLFSALTSVFYSFIARLLYSRKVGVLLGAENQISPRQGLLVSVVASVS